MAKEPSFLAKLNIFKKAETVDSDYLERDLLALKYYYQSNGFLKVKITQDLQIRKKGYWITYNIIEDTRLKIDSITVNIDNSELLREKLQSKISSYSQKKFSDQVIYDITKIINAYLLENSYLNNSVKHSFSIKSDSSLVNLSFQINLGLKFMINQINYHGLTYVDPKILEHQIPLPDSFYYQPEKMELIHDQLSKLNHFRSISIETSHQNALTNTIPLDIYLTEYPKRQFKAGVGYGLEDKFRAFVEYIRLDFLGNARKLTVNAKTSGLEPWNINLKIQEPLPFRYSMYSLINPFWLRQKEDVYEINRLGILLGYTQDITPRHSYQLHYLFERNHLLSADVFNSDSLAAHYNKSSVFLNYNTNFVKESKGLTTSLNLSYSGRLFNSTYNFFKWIADNRYYLPVSRINSFAFKAKYARLYSFNTDKIIPVEERFYAGGSNSIRGWSRNEISPLNSNNETTGGNCLLETSLENRTIIYPKIEFAIFYDGGNVWADNLQWDHFLSSAGAGIRYYSLLGPIRLDFAVPLFDKKKSIEYYLQIGQSF